MVLEKVKNGMKRVLPTRMFLLYRTLRNVRDFGAVLRFLRNKELPLSRSERLRMIRRFYAISFRVDSPHTQEEILSYVTTLLTLPQTVRGSVVEAGCYKGGSTAKFSLAAKAAHRRLIVFDSFEGLPENVELHDKNIFNRPASFKKGDYAGALEEVRSNVSTFGRLEVCEFIKGWFDNTMPSFREPLAEIYLDVDLASSTRTCLKYLYPLLQPGGVLYSQDGHLPLVLEVFDDAKFWENEVGCPKPIVEGLRTRKLLKIVKL